MTRRDGEALRLVSWNLAQRLGCWDDLAADKSIDLALLQEAPTPQGAFSGPVLPEAAPWRTDGHGPWRTAVAVMSDRTEASSVSMTTTAESEHGAVPESVAGTLTAARVDAPGLRPIHVVSAYAAWDTPFAGDAFADGAAHRIISDLSALVTNRAGHRVIVAGDWNILHGYGEHGDDYWAARYQTVFDRMQAIGLEFVGPRAPGGGRQADPWPDELPSSSRNVPTFKQRGSITRQLDFVFASTSLEPQVSARALNGPDEWGRSDHCRILIEIAADP